MFTLPERFRTRTAALLGTVALLTTGGGIGAAAMRAATPVVAMAPGKPVSLASLAGLTLPLIGERVVTVSGKVADVYGSRFVLADASGRALIEAGHDGSALVATGQAVTVQGRYDAGVVHARFIVGADGLITALRDRRGAHRRHGERHSGGRDQTEPVVAPPAPTPSLTAQARPTQG